MSRKNKKVCTIPNYIEHYLILASAITECISISGFSSFLGIPIGITSSAIGLKVCAITTGIKKYKSIIKKKKSLLDSNISHEEFVLIMCQKNMII